MVGFAGSKYAARSYPAKVADGSHTITSFTLVMIINLKPFFKTKQHNNNAFESLNLKHYCGR